VPGFPGVCVRDLDEAGRNRNLEQLRRIGRLCRQYGQEFILATWQQTPWTESQRHMVEGLPVEGTGLSEYCSAGMKELLIQCPEIEGVQLRVNFEAGVGDQKSNDEFWKRVIEGIAGAGRRVRLDLRAKGLTDELIRFALETGLDITVPTKFWCEHTGLPYHLSQMRTEELMRLDNFNHSRRYSYSNLLRKPQQFDVLYRLWNYGSTCIFAWGDPEYAGKFSSSCQLGAVGFQIDSALSLEGGHEMLQSEPWNLYSNPELQPDGWEDERYWLRYVLFGRLGYSTGTCEEVWRREFRMRFGQDAAPYAEACCKTASKILPLITAAHMPAHPSQMYWPEISTGAALFGEHNHDKFFGSVTYGSSEPSDPGIFYGIDDYVEDLNKGRLNGKYTPLQVGGWLKSLAGEVRKYLDVLDRMDGLESNREYRQLRLDFLMLAYLAEFHVQKIEAAAALSCYRVSGKASCLAHSLDAMKKAGDCWRELCRKGENFHHNLEFGMGPGTGRHGHWKDKLPEVESDIARLESMLNGKVVPGENVWGCPNCRYDADAGEPVFNRTDLHYSCPDEWKAGWDLEFRIEAGKDCDFQYPPVLHYRHANQLEGKFRTAELEKTDYGYRGVIEGEYISPEWDLLVYFSAVDHSNRGIIYPGLYHSDYPAPYHIIRVTGE